MKRFFAILAAVAANSLFAARPDYETLIAHRGESYDAPENTLPAYEMAVERGFGFECDVYLSTDGRVFSFHDSNLKRTTGVDLDCNKASWEEVVSKIDAGAWKGDEWKGTRPALLEEILALARDGRYIYLEIKTGPEIVPYIKRCIEAQRQANAGNLLFISFNEASLKAVKEQLPGYKALLLQGDFPADRAIATCRRLGIDGVDLYYDSRRVTAEYVRTLADAGFETHVWTVDALGPALSAFARGVRSVTTNCAKKLLDGFNAKVERERGTFRDLNGNGWMDVYEDESAKVEDRVHDLWGQMLAEEKIGQLNMPFCEGGCDGSLLAAAAAGKVGFLINHGESRSDRDEIQKHAVAGSRLGIPIMFCMDVIHGCDTIFPIAPAMAGTFDPALYARAQEAAAREAAAHGIDAVFTPDCDVALDPRWGRVAETCGEDPFLAAQCVAAQVRGLKAGGVEPCLKHFAGYSAVVGGRDYNAADVGMWELRNRHLPPFKAGIDAGARMVMSSFNTLDGVPSVRNKWLLTDLLRGEWGFDGVVTADWNGVEEQVKWGIAADSAEATATALEAGNDVDMTSGDYLRGWREAVARKELKTATIDRAVQRVLKLKFASGLFSRRGAERAEAQSQSSLSLSGSASSAPLREKLSLECAEKSLVLLKNDGVLPLAEGAKVAVVGPMATSDEEAIGCWVIYPKRASKTLADALKEVCNVVAVAEGCKAGEDVRFKTDGTVEACGANTEETENTETRRNGEEKSPCLRGLQNLRANAVGDADVLVLAIGETRGWTGENASRCTLGLTGRQQELFDEAAKLGKPIVSVVFAGRPLALPEVYAKSAAVVYAWQPGSEGNAAIANVLAGKASPEGRLSMSIPSRVGAVPAYYNHAATGRPNMGDYRDGSREAAFPFGFGLGYTTFAYEGERIEGDEAVATVRNTGGREGVETVQLYVRQCVCREGARPVRELRGFEKVRLAPGEAKEVRFRLDAAALGYVARDGSPRCDAGEYVIWVAPHSGAGKAMKYQK